MILDTNFLIDFLNGKQDAVSKMSSLIEYNIAFAITTPTIFELWSGLISLEKSEKEKQKTISLINEQIVQRLDKESAEIGGRIDGELIKKGLEIDVVDSMIAGIALAHNKKILTRDKHFNRVEGLKVENY